MNSTEQVYKSPDHVLQPYRSPVFSTIGVLFVILILLKLKRESELSKGLKTLLGEQVRFRTEYKWSLKFPYRQISAVLIRPSPGVHLDITRSLETTAFLERVFYRSDFRDAGSKGFKGWNRFETMRKV